MTARRDRSVTSLGRHSAHRPRRPWRAWTAAVVVGASAATAFTLRDEIAPAIRLDGFSQPADAAPVAEDAPRVEAVYPPEAPVVAGAQVDPPGATGPGEDAARASGTAEPDVSSTSARTAAAVPPRSGKGRRIVFAMADQRVWLVRKDGTVAHTYPVSGSKHDNLDPGSYEVYSRSRHATSYDLGSTMEYFVRFTRGKNAPIGFHSIPVDGDGEPLQSRAQLGTPLSSGCVRQHVKDAVVLWRFAPVGTKVVVVA